VAGLRCRRGSRVSQALEALATCSGGSSVELPESDFSDCWMDFVDLPGKSDFELTTFAGSRFAVPSFTNTYALPPQELRQQCRIAREARVFGAA
jgi:hypothetical protein